MLLIHALPAFNDNYIWLLENTSLQTCAVVDPGDALPVLAWLAEHTHIALTDILITHHHADHTGGVNELVAQTHARVFAPANEHVPKRDISVDEGAHFFVQGKAVQVMSVPGHTKGHVVYFFADEEQPMAFTGDTLFAAGCGRLFEGTPAQMLKAMQRLRQLPANTLIYCAHEYTLSNLRFAHAVEPENLDIQQRLADVENKRHKNQITLPTNIELEQQTNPFMRFDQAHVIHKIQQRLQQSALTDVEVFAAIRAWKDQF